jgi:hypothetical protein
MVLFGKKVYEFCSTSAEFRPTKKARHFCRAYQSLLSGSNQRPTDYKSVALPAELRRRISVYKSSVILLKRKTACEKNQLFFNFSNSFSAAAIFFSTSARSLSLFFDFAKNSKLLVNTAISCSNVWIFLR